MQNAGAVPGISGTILKPLKTAWTGQSTLLCNLGLGIVRERSRNWMVVVYLINKHIPIAVKVTSALMSTFVSWSNVVRVGSTLDFLNKAWNSTRQMAHTLTSKVDDIYRWLRICSMTSGVMGNFWKQWSPMALRTLRSTQSSANRFGRFHSRCMILIMFRYCFIDEYLSVSARNAV